MTEGGDVDLSVINCTPKTQSLRGCWVFYFSEQHPQHQAKPAILTVKKSHETDDELVWLKLKSLLI